MIIAPNDVSSPFRLATPDNIDAILPLATSTVPGFVEHLWTRLADNTETAIDFGRRAQMAFIDNGQTIVAEVDGQVAAMLICYPMVAEPNPHVPGMDELLLPLMTLFAKAAGTWYLHGLATEPAFAGRGYGSQLMDIAETAGQRAGYRQISLVVIDTNESAIRFYERRGYRTTATKPVIKMGWQTEARDWLLMQKPI